VTSELVRLFLALTLEHVTCGFACCRKEWGKRDNDNKRYTMRGRERDLWGGGRETVNRKRKLSAVFFTTDTKSFIHVTRIAALHNIFTRIGCALFTCDMYMCRLRHINDSVLSSLKMEGIRLLFWSELYQAATELNLLLMCFKWQQRTRHNNST
jgi:Fe-S-cluster containining protein